MPTCGPGISLPWQTPPLIPFGSVDASCLTDAASKAGRVADWPRSDAETQSVNITPASFFIGCPSRGVARSAVEVGYRILSFLFFAIQFRHGSGLSYERLASRASSAAQLGNCVSWLV